MACADTVDPECRIKIRSAITECVRCLKCVVKNAEVDEIEVSKVDNYASRQSRTISVVKSMRDSGQPIDKEFFRCVSKEADASVPFLFLFRTDDRENIQDCRWLLVAWVPKNASEVDRAIYMRSSTTLGYAVPNPYYLTELAAKDLVQLSWPSVLQVGSLFGGAIASSTRNPAALPIFFSKHQLTMASGISPSGIVPHQQLQGGALRVTMGSFPFIVRFAKKEEPCIRLFLAKEDATSKKSSAAASKTLALEAQPMHYKTAAALGPHLVVPNNCYYALHLKDSLLIMLWCPESAHWDRERVAEDTKYALVKNLIPDLLLKSFCLPHPMISFMDLQNLQDFEDMFGLRSSKDIGGQPLCEVLTPSALIVGNVLGLRGVQPPATVPTSSITSSLAFPERPVPYWRGGSRIHTIGTRMGPSIAIQRTNTLRVATNTMTNRDLSN